MRKAVLVVVATLVATLFSPVATAQAVIPRPQIPIGLPRMIEPLAYYVGQSSCDPAVKPGTAKLRQLILNTYPGSYVGTSYPCGTNGRVSEHYEGRALDWSVSTRDATQYAQARAFLAWLNARDYLDRPFAMARRLGVQYYIYNGRIWGSWDGKSEEYQGCATKPQPQYDNLCHRDHMHISLSWRGALGYTSFWTRNLYNFDYGPCRAKDLNWAPIRRTARLTECEWYPTVHAAAGASVLKQQLVAYSGAYLRYRMRGPIVEKVQTALHISRTAVFDSATVTAVSKFQFRHGIVVTGTMTQPTWRHLLPLVR